MGFSALIQSNLHNDLVLIKLIIISKKSFDIFFLPFGLSSACHLFTKLTKPLVHYCRLNGIVASMYIDDGLIASPDFESASANVFFVRNLITNSGFVPSKTKCVWSPTKAINHLGLIIDSDAFCFLVPRSKIETILTFISSLLDSHRSKQAIPVRDLARFADHMISSYLALGPVARFTTRCSYRAIESRRSWHDYLVLPEDAVSELKFWLTHLRSLNGFTIRSRLAPSLTIYSDASDTGYGGHVEGRSLQVQGNSTLTEQRKSSTWRELAAVRNVLSQLTLTVSGKNVKWYSDNSNVPIIMQCGSPKSDLHKLAVQIFDMAKELSCVLLPEWLPRP